MTSNAVTCISNILVLREGEYFVARSPAKALITYDSVGNIAVDIQRYRIVAFEREPRLVNLAWRLVGIWQRWSRRWLTKR